MPTVPIILVAEDDAADQILLRRAIEKAAPGVHVDFVVDGFAACEYLEHPPDGCPVLLILDLKMPGLDGFQVLEWLRERPILRPPHVVVHSASTCSQDIVRANGLAVDHYLVKPGEFKELVATVKRLEPYWEEPSPLVAPQHIPALPINVPAAA